MGSDHPLQRTSIAVIGAGISGLICAWELQQRGLDVTVYEKEATVGGRMMTRLTQGLYADLGANFFAGDSVEIQRYCRAFNVPYEPIREPVRFIQYHGRLVRFGRLRYPSLAYVLPRLIFNWSALIKTMVHALREGHTLYDLSLTDERWDAPTADVVLNAIGNDFNTYVFSAPVEGLLFYGTEELSQTFLLNAWHQGAHSLGKPTYYSGTMDALPRAIAQALHIEHVRVEHVEPTGNHVTVTTSTGEHSYDTVVIACPPTGALYSGTPAQRHLVESLRYASSISAAFRVPKDLIEEFSLLYVPRQENSIISVLTNEGRKQTDKGFAVLGVALHHSFTQRILASSDEYCIAVMRREIPKILPALAGIIENAPCNSLQRWSHAIPIYSPAWVTLVRDFWRNGQGQNNVYFCGDYMNHPFVEGSIRCGIKVAHRILEH